MCLCACIDGVYETDVNQHPASCNFAFYYVCLEKECHVMITWHSLFFYLVDAGLVVEWVAAGKLAKPKIKL